MEEGERGVTQLPALSTETEPIADSSVSILAYPDLFISISIYISMTHGKELAHVTTEPKASCSVYIVCQLEPLRNRCYGPEDL